MTGGVRHPAHIDEPCSLSRPARPHQEGGGGHVCDLGGDVRGGVAKQRRLHQPALVVHLLPLYLRVGHCAACTVRVSDARKALACQQCAADVRAPPGFFRRRFTYALHQLCNLGGLSAPCSRRLHLQSSLPLAPWGPAPLAAGSSVQAGAGAVMQRARALTRSRRYGLLLLANLPEHLPQARSLQRKEWHWR